MVPGSGVEVMDASVRVLALLGKDVKPLYVPSMKVGSLVGPVNRDGPGLFRRLVTETRKETPPSALPVKNVSLPVWLVLVVPWVKTPVALAKLKRMELWKSGVGF